MHMKRLGNGLIVVGSAIALWRFSRIVALSAYSKTGPFSNGGAPAISKAFLDGVENYLNPSVARSGVPLQSWFGPYTVTTTTTRFNHNLVDAAGSPLTPDLVTVNVCGRFNSLHTVSYDNTTMNSTGVELTADASTLTVTGVAYKF